MNIAEAKGLLQFWKPPEDHRLRGAAAARKLAEIHDQVSRMNASAGERFAEIAKEQFEEQDRVRADVAGRASQLLLFVGVVSTGTTIVAGSFSSLSVLVTAMTLIFGIALLYALLAIGWLAVQAQRVRDWSRPEISPPDVTTRRALEIENTARTYFHATQNKLAVSDLVAHLRDAQWWARTAIALMAVLAVLAVAASGTKRPDVNAPCNCAPISTVAPTVGTATPPAVIATPSATPARTSMSPPSNPAASPSLIPTSP